MKETISKLEMCICFCVFMHTESLQWGLYGMSKDVCTETCSAPFMSETDAAALLADIYAENRATRIRY